MCSRSENHFQWGSGNLCSELPDDVASIGGIRGKPVLPLLEKLPPPFLIFHPAGELQTPPSGQPAPWAGCGGHGHTQQLPSRQQAHGRISSLRRICSNLSKDPGQLSTGYESASYEKHVLRNCGSAVFTQMEH